jgi:hypothetical protein
MIQKHIILLISLLCLLLNGSYAQTQFPDKDGEWYISYTGDGDVHYSKQPIYVEKDTIINGLTYSIMINSVRCAVRNDYPKVFYIDLNHPENNENLLYDFGLNLGDSVQLIHFVRGYEPDTSFWKVSNVQYFEINGSQRKQIDIESRNTITIGYNTWLEGIGSTMGPVYPIMCSFFENYYDLYCYRENGIAISGNCNLINSIQSIKNPFESLYSNLHNQLTIRNGQKSYNLAICNYLGKIVYETFDCSDETIDLNGFHPGVYICHFTIENQIYSQKFVVEN